LLVLAKLLLPECLKHRQHIGRAISRPGVFCFEKIQSCGGSDMTFRLSLPPAASGPAVIPANAGIQYRARL
jgi:hypothetical protein